MPLPIVPLALGAASLAGTIWSARSAKQESARNRDFQERMANTAHEREVADLRRSGLNPMLGAMRGGGAAAPSGSMANLPDFGEGASRAVASALAVRQAKANIELTQAQAAAANASGQLSNVQAGDILKTQAGRLTLQEAQTRLAGASASERSAMLPLLIEKAKAEIISTTTSAERLKVLKLLDELAVQGARNTEKFEKELGDKGRWANLILQVLRAAAPYRY